MRLLITGMVRRSLSLEGEDGRVEKSETLAYSATLLLLLLLQSFRREQNFDHGLLFSEQ